ncbi:MAG: hypothetical protein K2M91_03475 [Lachnospiraceae bacterium]|nr:hypothetical protein [Lachnospiraceae bacterium]
MVALDDPIWKEVSSAGNDVDELLYCLMNGEGDFREDMECLAEDLSCQFSFYDATCYVLPHLAALCSTLSLEDKVFLISQIGPAIAAEAYQPNDPILPGTEAYQEFEEGLRGLRLETKSVITDPAIAAILGSDLRWGQDFALAALAILGDRVHAYGLYFMFDFEWERGLAACSCGWETTELAIFDDRDRDFLDMHPATIAPWDGKFDNEPVWFQGLVKLIGDQEFLQALPWLYGTCTCPDCKKQEAYWKKVGRRLRHEHLGHD